MPKRSIPGWLLIGLAAGILGRFLMPGKDPGGFIVTFLIGIAGALLAGFVARGMGWTLSGGWQNYGAATAGAVVLPVLYRVVVGQRALQSRSAGVDRGRAIDAHVAACSAASRRILRCVL